MVSALFMVLVVLVTLVGASAKTMDVGQLPVTIDWVKVGGDVLDTNDVVNKIDRNDAYEVKIKVIADNDGNDDVDSVLEDLSVEARMNGYDHNDQVYGIDYESIGFLSEDHSDTVTLNLQLPYRLDEGEYSLTITVADKLDDYTLKYVLYVEPEEHNMLVKDVVFSPSSTVVAGRSLMTTVYLKNIGNDDDEEGVKVSMSVPALGISAVDYIDTLDEEEATSSEELWIVVPKCAPAGEYDAVVEVEFKEGDKSVSTTETITVVEDANSQCGAIEKQSEKTIIAVAGATQDVTQGEGVAIYPLTLTNDGAESKTYVVEVDGYQDWAKVSLTPSNVAVVEAGESKAVYAYVTALDNAAPGEHMFSLVVKSGSDTLKEVALKANVVENADADAPSKWAGVKKVLEVGLIVLIVLLVILGLIVGFNKLKGDDDDEFDDDEDKNYY